MEVGGGGGGRERGSRLASDGGNVRRMAAKVEAEGGVGEAKDSSGERELRRK